MTKRRNDVTATSTIRNDRRETVTIKLIGFDPDIVDAIIGVLERTPTTWDIARTIDHARTNR